MARYGRDHVAMGGNRGRGARQPRGGRGEYGGGNQGFDWYRGRGMPGSWTHWGAGHGRGGSIDDEDAWRTNRDEYRRGGGYGREYQPGMGGHLGSRRSRSGYGMDYPRGRYDRSW